PGNHTNYMVTGHPNNGLQDLGSNVFSRNGFFVQALIRQ
ncbi:hypothetical protein, partial [uncultured Gammaproteobacteria bacterium]